MMKLRIAFFCALTLTQTIPLSQPASAAPAAAKVKWVFSNQQAIQQAKSTGKPIFIDFYTTWCGPCKLLEAHTYSDEKFVSESKKWIMLKIDAEKSPKLADKYGVTGYPTMVMTRPNGKVLQSLSGYWEAKTLIKEMRDAAKDNKSKG